MSGPTATTSPVQRSAFSSRDEEEITDFMRRVYVDQRTSFASADGDARFETTTAEVAGVGADLLRSTIDYRQVTDPFDYFLSFLVRGGQVRVRGGRSEALLRPGDVTACPLGVPVHFDMSDMDLGVVRLPVRRLEQVAQDVWGLPPAQLRFEGSLPVSPAMHRYWRALVGVVGGALVADESPMSHALLAEEMTRTLALAALHVFPNTTMGRPPVSGPGDVAPAALRRAVDYIAANAHQPLTLSDIADAAGTSGRALQYAFRRHHDTTPLGYLRRERMERAHRELQAADPTRGDTVAAIAARWGFGGRSRFAAAYRDRYGQPPSRTLRT